MCTPGNGHLASAIGCEVALDRARVTGRRHEWSLATPRPESALGSGGRARGVRRSIQDAVRHDSDASPPVLFAVEGCRSHRVWTARRNEGPLRTFRVHPVFWHSERQSWYPCCTSPQLHPPVAARAARRTTRSCKCACRKPIGACDPLLPIVRQTRTISLNVCTLFWRLSLGSWLAFVPLSPFS